VGIKVKLPSCLSTKLDVEEVPSFRAVLLPNRTREGYGKDDACPWLSSPEPYSLDLLCGDA
jgi:hypothetical protein